MKSFPAKAYFAHTATRTAFIDTVNVLTDHKKTGKRDKPATVNRGLTW